MADSDPIAKKPTQFTCFSKLPFELRKQIWLEASSALPPRIITFSLLFKKYEAVPSLLHTCHESRTESMSSYTSVVFKDKNSSSNSATATTNSNSSVTEKRTVTATASSQSSTALTHLSQVLHTTNSWTRPLVLKLINFTQDIVHIRDGNFLRDSDSTQALRRDIVIARNIARFGGFAKLVRRLAISDFLLDRSMFFVKPDRKVDFWCVVGGSFPQLEEVVILSYGDWCGLRDVVGERGGTDVMVRFERFPDA